MRDVNDLKKHIYRQDFTVWTLYFIIMLNFYTFTYVQLIAQFMLIWYVIVFRGEGKYKKKNLNIVYKFFSWYGLFVIWGWISLVWTQHSLREGFRPLITMLRIAVIGGCIIYYLQTTKRVHVLVKAMICAGIFFSVFTILINPINSWGKESFISYGNGFVRTGIATIGLLMLFLLFLFEKIYNQAIKWIITFIFVTLILLTGSRGAILQLLIFAGLIGIASGLKIGIIKKEVTVLIVVLFVFGIMCCVPYFYNTFVLRIQKIFYGIHSSDASTVGRLTYIKVALEMAKEHIILGSGTDAFYNYLLNYKVFTDFGLLNPVYSHCNYTEILVSCGAVGLILFYRFHFSVLAKNWKYKKRNRISKVLICWIITWLIGDFATVEYTTHMFMYFYCIIFYIHYDNTRCLHINKYLVGERVRN